MERGVTKGLAAGAGGAPPRVQWVWGTTLYHKDDLPFDLPHLPDVYTQFRQVRGPHAYICRPACRSVGSRTPARWRRR